MTTEILQEKVIQLFKNKLNKKSEIDLSYPLIPRISNNYLSNRVVIIGQETNTWYKTNKMNDYNYFVDSSIKDVYNDGLIKRYDIFSKNSIEKYGGKFWEFQKKLYQENILPNNIIENNQLNHCWINLFAMEACQNKQDNNGRPTRNKKVRDAVLNLQQDLMYDLLKLLEPKIIIFLTGNSLDYIIEKSLGIASNSMKKTKIIDLLETNQACKILTEEKSIFNKCTIIRLYHPTYFMARINTFKKLQKDLNNAGIAVSNAKFYTERVILYLKDI